MWEYTPAPSSDELYHHGVKGMKWGVRKKKYVTVRQASKNASKAYKDSFKEDKARSKSLREQGEKGITVRQATKNANKARKDSVINDVTYNKGLRQQKKMLKKVEKMERKEFIKKRSKEILAGENFLGKVWDITTDGHKLQAELEYNLDKRYPDLD